MRSRIVTSLTLALLGVLICSSTLLAITRAEIDNKYKWKTEHIYPNLKAWETDFDSLKTSVDKLTAFKGTFAGKNATDAAKSLIDYNRLSDWFNIKAEHLFGYIQFNYSVDLSNTEWMGRLQQLGDFMVEYGQKMSWVQPELLTIPQATMMGYVDHNPALQAYRKSYEDMYLLQQHTLSAPEERILALSEGITGTAADVYNKLTDVDLDFGYVKLDNGDSIRADYNTWTSYRTNKDRNLREKIFKAVWNKYSDFGTSLAALMAGNIKKNIYLSEARKYDNTLQSALSNNFIPESVYTNLVTTTKANTAPFHKYDEVRKRILGVDHYRHWDYYVSLIPADETRYSWKDGVKIVTDALQPLGKDYIKDITTALTPENGWVDPYTSENKRNGAFSASCYGVHNYMLFNFDYKKGMTLDEVSAIAHEVGHSMHSMYSEKAQPFPNRDYAIFNAEVASTTNETLLAMKLLDEARKAYKRASAKDKPAAKQKLIYLLEQNINGVRDTFLRQTMFATWEWEANKMGEQNKPLTKDSFNKLYLDLLKEFHGPAAEYKDLSGVSWSTIPHFYRGYYVYSYATSYAAAVALAKDIRAEAAGDKTKKGATAKYLTYLKSGSSKHPVELLKDAGVDMTTPAPIVSLITYFSGLVDELDKLTK